MKTWCFLFFSLCLLLSITGCEEDITVDVPTPENQIVVEGWIEQKQPPFVIVNENAAFFGQANVNDIDSFYVHDATVVVSNSQMQDTLREYCLSEFANSGLESDIAQAFGVPVSDNEDLPNICIYTVDNISEFFLNPKNYTGIRGKLNTQYNLTVKAQGRTITGTDRIREKLPLDSLSFVPKKNDDTLVTVYAHFFEPKESGNFVRYFTKRNDEPFIAPLGASVFDDNFFSGDYFRLPLERGERANDVGLDESGYFYRGDTVIVRWTHISKQHYDFWNTVEYDQSNSSNPFSSPTRINSNVQGGLGVWGGYAADYDTIIIPKE